MRDIMLLAAYSVTMFVILVRIYLRPYQEATGTLLFVWPPK